MEDERKVQLERFEILLNLQRGMSLKKETLIKQHQHQQLHRRTLKDFQSGITSQLRVLRLDVQSFSLN